MAESREGSSMEQEPQRSTHSSPCQGPRSTHSSAWQGPRPPQLEVPRLRALGEGAASSSSAPELHALGQRRSTWPATGLTPPLTANTKVIYPYMPAVEPVTVRWMQHVVGDCVCAVGCQSCELLDVDQDWRSRGGRAAPGGRASAVRDCLSGAAPTYC